MDDINGKEEKYTGEVGPDGLPHGRGTIDFGDGRRYSGTIDGASQTGRGVYYYPDGSRFIGGFTVNTEYPAWRFVYPDGREVAGFVSRFPAGDEEVGAGNLTKSTPSAPKLPEPQSAGLLVVEYNARTILADALCRRGRGC